MNAILAIAVGLIINGIIAFGIAKVSKNLWMVAGLVVVFKILEVITGEWLGVQNISSIGSWIVTGLTGFLFFMITVQLFYYLRDKALDKETEKLENSKV